MARGGRWQEKRSGNAKRSSKEKGQVGRDKESAEESRHLGVEQVEGHAKGEGRLHSRNALRPHVRRYWGFSFHKRQNGAERRWCAQDVHHFARWALALEPKSPDSSPGILLRSVTGKTGQWARHARPEAAGAESHGGGRKALPKAGSPIKHQRPRWPSPINPGNQLPRSDFPAVTALNGFGLEGGVGIAQPVFGDFRNLPRDG